jgi:fatty acid desaturase
MGRERLALYSLVGPESDRAVERGLANAVWFKADVPRKRMKELMQRSDAPAVRDTAIWLGGIVVLGAAGAWIWTAVSPWLAAPVFFLYGLLYGSGGDSRWHEAGHGTAFKTRWMDTSVYEIASFMMMREPTVWRWTHTRHHTDTLIVGRDPEIAAMRPARLVRILLNFFGLVDVPTSFRLMFLHAFGRLTPDEAEVVPEPEHPRVYRKARIWLAIYAATVAIAVLTGSIVPFLLIGGPRVYATFMHLTYALTQHAGMGEDVLDHRLNTRTVKMCWFNRFLYWNMNYHVEHHMFPMVPYHRLPDLHEEIQHELAPVYPSIWAAYKELVPAILKQLKDQSYYVRRELPPGATPFNEPALAG